MRVNWYNVRVHHHGNESNISERLNKMGRYAKRKDVEPLIREMEKTLKDYRQQSKIIQQEIQSIRQQCSMEGNDKTVYRCTEILNRLKNIS